MTLRAALPAPEPGRLDGIQVLRGLAALMVALGHYHGTAVARGFELKLFDQIAIAAAGVDIFFVISGFIMELTVRGGASASRPDFLARRAIRLLPLYWALTLAAFALSRLPLAGVSAQYPAETLLYSLLLLPWPAADGSGAYLISVAWSLTYELYFYLLFALLLTSPSRRRIGALLLVFMGSVLVGVMTRPSSPLARMVTDPMLLEFLAGCVVGHLYRSGFRLPAWWGPACIAIAIAWLGSILKYSLPDGQRLLWWGLPAMFLVVGVALAPPAPPLRLLKPLVVLGDLSYALYLTHFFALALFVRLWRPLSERLSVSPWLALLAFLTLSIALSMLCYRAIELPSRKFLTERWRQGRKRWAPA